MVSKKKTTRKEKRVLDVSVADVFVAHNAKRRAYIEQFSYTSVNFTQKHLGTICGFFIVRDKSPWSAHVVNFLAAEIKKEFFALSKRTIEEAFEAALHHGNRALAELAQNDNIHWLGKLDGVVCAFDEEKIFFSATGEGHILLVRDDEMMLLSEGLASPFAAENPLKTFVDTAHGKLHANDKIIITSSELLELISLAELEKNIKRFNRESFTQFISTILTNECHIAATTIIDVTEKTIREPLHIARSEEENGVHEEIVLPENAFSQDTYKKKRTTSVAHEIHAHKEQDAFVEKTDYTDKRTGHIYIHGDDTPHEHTSHVSLMLTQTRDVIGDFTYATHKRVSIISRKYTTLIARAPQTLLAFIVRRIPTQSKKDVLVEERVAPQKHVTPVQHAPQKPSQQGIQSTQGQQPPAQQSPSTKREIAEDVSGTQNMWHAPIMQMITQGAIRVLQLLRVLAHYLKRATTTSVKKMTSTIFERAQTPQKETSRIQETATTSLSDAPDYTILPHLHRITRLWRVMSPVTKWTAFGFIVVLITIPLLFHYIHNHTPVTITTPEEKRTETPPVVQEAPSATFDTAHQIATVTDALFTASIAEGSTLIATSKSILLRDKEQNEEIIPLSADIGSIQYASYMDDLSLLFFITDNNTLHSFSPITKDFNTQTLPDTIDYTQIHAIGTYLTYLYILRDDTITRYARTDTGFGSPIQWFTGGVFVDATGFAIDGSVYVAKNGTFDTFFQRKKINRTLPDTVAASLVYATEDTQFLWILDKEHGQITGHNKETFAIEKTFTHEALKNVTTFSINEETNTATVATADGVYSIPLN